MLLGAQINTRIHLEIRKKVNIISNNLILTVFSAHVLHFLDFYFAINICYCDNSAQKLKKNIVNYQTKNFSSKEDRENQLFCFHHGL